MIKNDQILETYLSVIRFFANFSKKYSQDPAEISPSSFAGYAASNGSKFTLWVNLGGEKLSLKVTQILQTYELFVCFSENLGRCCLEIEATLLNSRKR